MRKGLQLVGLLIVGTVFLLGWGRDVGAVESAVYVDLKASEATNAPVIERWKLYGSSYALVIGIDDYGDGWPRLSNAIKDARYVASALEDQGFDVTLRTDLTGDELSREIRNFYAYKGSDPDARLIVWFAGHGFTQDGQGYLVPADAGPPGQPAFFTKALPMGYFGSLVRLAKAKHAMAIFDSCFAGSIFNVQRSRPPAAITEATKSPVRQFLTSGDAEQQVADDGTFRNLFIDALRGDVRADANRDGYLTGTELSLFLQVQMTNLTDSHQTPRSGKLRDRLFDKGDFVFVLPRRQVDSRSEASDPGRDMREPSDRTMDLEFWNAIKTSTDPADYKAYLKKFPKGTFADLAQKRAQGVSSTKQSSPEPVISAKPPTGAILDDGQRRQIQQALKTRGYYRGAIDGIFGTGSEAAVRQFQAAIDEAVTGILTEGQARRLMEVRIAAESKKAAAQLASTMDTGTTAPAKSGRSKESSAETAFWRSIDGSQSPSDFRAYLTKYGDAGTFSSLASNQLAALEATRKSATTRGSSSGSSSSSSGSVTQRQLSRADVDEAADAILQARQMMDELSQKADSILGQHSVPMDERIRTFRGMLGQVADFEPMAKYVLGPHRATATRAQWERFLRQYQEIFLSGYEFTAADSWTGDWSVQNIRPFGQKDDFLVTVSFRKKTGDYTKVGIRVRPRRGTLFGFVIVDAMMDGVSLLVTQRSEYSSILKREGIDGLVAVLERKYGKAIEAIEIPD